MYASALQADYLEEESTLTPDDYFLGGTLSFSISMRLMLI
jgi:hypothetical protein